jgi:hypothetical protein
MSSKLVTGGAGYQKMLNKRTRTILSWKFSAQVFRELLTSITSLD